MRTYYILAWVTYLSAAAWAAVAQTTPKELLRSKTEAQIREIAARSTGLLGLAAVDLTSGERFEVNPNAVFPQGSAIKIPILMEVYQQAEQGRFKLHDQLPLNPATSVGGTGILKNLTDLKQLSIGDLCTLMMVLSDNTATNRLIELVGMDNVNRTIKSVGLKQTRLQRRMMDAAASGRGEENLSTPGEAVRLMETLYKGTFVSRTVCDGIAGVMTRMNREDSRIAKGLPEDVPLIFKPGTLPGVSTEWAVVYLKERPYVLVMMENFRTEETPGQVMEEVSRLLYQYFWRISRTHYGNYVDPTLLKNK